LSRGRAARPLLLLLAATLAALALGRPRFTWANEGVGVSHPPAQAAFALGAACALGAAAWAVRPRWLAVAGALGAAALVVLFADRLAFRLDAVETGVRQRSLGGSVELSWPEVAAVEPRPGSVTLHARNGRRLVIGTSGFAPDERVRLERSIARRVKEAAK
jgi:hypothetical protein